MAKTTKTTLVFAALQRVKYEGDFLIGVFSSEQKAEEGIVRYIASEVSDSDGIENALWNLASTWVVQVQELDGKEISTYQVSEDSIINLHKQL